MQGNTRKRSAHIGTFRKGSKAKTKAIRHVDRCEDTVADFGPWYYDGHAEMLVCEIPDFKATYEIDLDRCQTASQKCDWLAQIAEKTWGNRDVLGGLVQAFDTIVGLRPGVGERGI
jgi:hypothetical protein